MSDIELSLLHSIVPPSWETLAWIILANSVPTSQRIHCSAITRISWLMLYREIIPVYFHNHIKHIRSRESAAVIANGYGLDGRGVRVRVPVGARFSSLHVVETGSGAHAVSYPVRAGGIFTWGKAAGEWSWTLTSNQCQGQEYVDLYIHSLIHLHDMVLN
jgi:hypothetical protein